MLIVTTDEENIVKLGENQQENQKIIDDSEKGWVWFHADKFPSGHSVIETSTPTKQEIIQVATLVKSKCKLKNYRRGKIIYCPVNNLKSTGIPGEVNMKRRPKTITI